MGDWYTIGLVLGVALGVGIVLSGFLSANAIGLAIALAAGAGAGAALGFAVGDTAVVGAGVAGGLVGVASAAVLVRGALRRGGTRVGIGAFVGLAGLLVALLALVPILGYIEVLAVPIVAARMRGRETERFAGLRSLAK